MRVGCLYAGARGRAATDEVAAALARLGHVLEPRLELAEAPLAAYEGLRGCTAAANLAVGAPAALAAWGALVAERAGVPCLPSPAAALFACADRSVWRAVCRAAGLAVAPGFVVRGGALGRRVLRFPVAVRPADAGPEAVAFAWSRPALERAVAELAAAGREAVVEHLPAGRSLVVAVLDGRVLPPLEPAAGAAPPSPAPDGPAPPPRAAAAPAGGAAAEAGHRRAVVDAGLAGRLAGVALRAAEALRLRKAALLHLLWDGRRALLTGVDALPSLDRAGLLAQAAALAGLPYEGLWSALLSGLVPTGHDVSG